MYLYNDMKLTFQDFLLSHLHGGDDVQVPPARGTLSRTQRVRLHLAQLPQLLRRPHVHERQPGKAAFKEYNRGKYHCTIDLPFDWFGIRCMTTDNFYFYLQNRLIQTSQTGGQPYGDTSPFSIPCCIRDRQEWYHQLPFAFHEQCTNEIFKTNLILLILFLILFCPILSRSFSLE